MNDSVLFEARDHIALVTINRPNERNAVDESTAEALASAFHRFEDDDQLRVAILSGSGGTFCAGADLKAFADGRGNRLEEQGRGPMGPTRMLLSKPVLAAVEGYAVAGGLELALWCDLRIAARSAVFGVFCRRFGVPLIDLGTVRLPRLIGLSHALDLILTGRPVNAEEAYRMGLANRIVEDGQALEASLTLARELATLPQVCLRSDRLSAYEQCALAWDEALANEFKRGSAVLQSGESIKGAQSFASGAGRHGSK